MIFIEGNHGRGNWYRDLYLNYQPHPAQAIFHKTHDHRLDAAEYVIAGLARHRQRREPVRRPIYIPSAISVINHQTRFTLGARIVLFTPTGHSLTLPPGTQLRRAPTNLRLSGPARYLRFEVVAVPTWKPGWGEMLQMFGYPGGKLYVSFCTSNVRDHRDGDGGCEGLHAQNFLIEYAELEVS